METTELLRIAARGEDSGHQFKADARNAAALSAELVALANSGGGRIFIGVADDGTVVGLSPADVRRVNQLLSACASDHVRPPINPRTENVEVGSAGVVVVVTVADGISKPYMDNTGAVWVKSGADRRRVTSREELRRMFQSSGLVCADEVPVPNLPVSEVDLPFFRQFYSRVYGEAFEDQELPLDSLLENMNLSRNGDLNLAGAMLFARHPQRRLPAFSVKAVVFPGVEIHQSTYLDSRDITGKVSEQFDHAVTFVMTHIRHVQRDQSVNSVGVPEIPRIAVEELVANALIHRDYFVSAPVRLMVFDDRVELTSPGHLPNNLTVENIRRGASVIRNPTLASFAAKVLPYRGLGSGIIRATRAHPALHLEDDRDAGQFRAVMRRGAGGAASLAG